MSGAQLRCAATCCTPHRMAGALCYWCAVPWPFSKRASRGQERTLAKKANKVEKMKLKKGGQRAWEDVQALGQAVREGKTKWEDLDLDDVDLRLKWSGLFHRRKRAPGTFMMRLKVL